MHCFARRVSDIWKHTFTWDENEVLAEYKLSSHTCYSTIQLDDKSVIQIMIANKGNNNFTDIQKSFAVTDHLSHKESFSQKTWAVEFQAATTPSK